MVVALDDGRIVALDSATLEERWRWRVPGVPVTPAVAAGLVLVPTEDGVLHAIAGDGRTARAPVATPAPTVPPASLLPSPAGGAQRPDEVWTMTVASFGLGFTAVTVGPDGRVWLLGTDGDEIVEVDSAAGTLVRSIALDVELDLIQPDGDEWAPFAALPDGGFVIADSDHQRIHRLDAGGRVVASWGRVGTGDGEFVSPIGIVVHDDLVYVIDDNTCRVQAFTLDGRFVRRVGGGAVIGCTDMFAVADDGTAWVATDEGVVGFGADGEIAGRLGFANGQGLLLTRDPAGNLYLTDESGDLDRFALDGRHLARWTGFGVTPAHVRADGATFSIDYDTGILRRIDLPPVG